VDYGATQVFAIAPATGYHVADVLVDGFSVGPVTEYTFADVTANHGLEARFAIDLYPVTVGTGPHGTVTCASPVAYLATSTCTIAPDAGYTLDTFLDAGADAFADAADGEYTTPPVIGPRTLAATFKLALAGACGTASDCHSGFCVDGVCCESACPGQCEACDVSGHAGACTPVSGDPHGTRAACAGDGTACDGACDGVLASACAYPGASTACRPASCADGTGTLAAACNGAGACPPVQTQACGAYACGADACLGDCTPDTGCAAGNWCSAGVCVPARTAGDACGGDHQCASDHCVDGVCCDTACTGQCQACDVAGAVGTCSPVDGAPHGGRTACASDDTACGGVCVGAVSTAACVYPGEETACREPGCTGGVATLAASCNGAGACPPVQTSDCGEYVCGLAACRGDCAADTDCVEGFWCSGGICTPDLSAGVACTGDHQCGTGHCVDGVCCDAACEGPCAACDVAGSVGTCTPVTGAPHGSRPACATDGSLCGGACDGVTVDACAYPGAGTSCREADCEAGVAVLAAVCNGAGACPAPATQPCGEYGCGDGTCNGDCATDADCAPTAWCSGGLCVARGEPGLPCGGDHECGSGRCVDGLCCEARCDGQCEACDVAGSEGRCVPVTGAPHGGRAPCVSDGSACGGTCDGAARDACAYPGAETSCRDAGWRFRRPAGCRRRATRPDRR
jgi:hypothetical protein